jgi:hypothetical protein
MVVPIIVHISCLVREFFTNQAAIQYKSLLKLNLFYLQKNMAKL